jgi:hypothetical protein
MEEEKVGTQEQQVVQDRDLPPEPAEGEPAITLAVYLPGNYFRKLLCIF